MRLGGPVVSRLEGAAYTIPTDGVEGDGTITWDSTTLVLVQVWAADCCGIGYTYADAAIASLIASSLQEPVIGVDCFDIPLIRERLAVAVRNKGRSGMVACAISAMDAALWDLKARVLGQPLSALLGAVRRQIDVYGSGGFTTYCDERLRDQLSAWVDEDGCRFVKMKVGADPQQDPRRVAAARKAVGDAALFVDANGAFTPKAALRFAAALCEADIRWFEEPVSSDDEAGLAMLCRHAPPAIEIAAGEYIFTLDDARRLLQAGAVDVLQADVTRCGGISGFMMVAALAEAHHIDLSAHCAPSLHIHVACALRRVRHLEWFHDHARIE